MAITVQANILERRDTTEAWEYANPILGNRIQGWETDIYGSPVGMKMGNGVTHWDDLPYWFSAGLTGNFKEPFSGVSSLDITDWVTDVPTDQTLPYVTLLGQTVKPLVMTGTAHAFDKTDFSMHIVTDTDDVTIISVTLDWGFVADGYVQW